MINIIIDTNGVPSSDMIKLGNEHENLDEVVQFTFPGELEPLHKYVIAKTYDLKTKEDITRVTPLVDNKFVVGSAITKVTGTWVLYTLCKSYKPNAEDGTERVSISDPIIAVVNQNNIDIEELESTEIDPNIKIIYDELISFKKELETNEATRQSNEAERVNNELSRINAETARIEAESARDEAEASRASAETARAEAEQSRASNETARQAEEVKREQAEATRAETEATRAEAEDKRVENEQLRINAEVDRTQYETLRRQSEGIRLSNEESRSDAEKTRVQSEQERLNAEASRTTAETARATDESKRVTAETNRANAEHIRSEAETSRINAEQSRADNEQLRVTAEQGRVEAEALRVEAENERSSTITKLREDVDANTKNGAVTQRSLEALWDLNKGISYKFETDSQEAYSKQVPSGAKLGSVNKIGGRTIVMNQYSNVEGKEGGWAYPATDYTNLKVLSNHKLYLKHRYVVKEILDDTKESYLARVILFGDENKNILNSSYTLDDIAVGKSFRRSEIVQAPNNFTEMLYYCLGDDTAGLTVNCDVWVNLIDLTQMFGEGNEPSTTEEFESMFPNDYYPYDEGTIMNMPVNEVVEIGKSSTATDYAPYAESSYPIPQAILDLEGYGWGVNNVHNYVDYESKKFYKCVGRVDLGTIGFYAYRDVSFMGNAKKN